MLKLNRLNRNQKLVECLIVVEDIDGITEKAMEDKVLYDENGIEAQRTPTESIYQIHFKNGREIYVTKETYDKLLGKLQVETL